ncbi:hydrolase [Solibacillus sp. R5-41]|nr:zinc dependent phospholipase C family protein [Solibacillus sp. R5-41]ATP39517.1 hydrolase [Solibacillus sp. R5-41]
MGSRIMHLIIANKIAKSIAIQDRTSFLLGGIAADAASNKDLSHFFTGSAHDYSRSVDYNSFLHKYRLQAENDFVLGYFTHLIADDIWLKGFYLPWLKNRMESNEEMINLYHNDFRLLNGKLLEYYGYTEELQELLEGPATIVELEEVKLEDFKKFIPYVIEDMNCNESEINEKLKVFTFDQIVGYVETSVEMGLFWINQKRDSI